MKNKYPALMFFAFLILGSGVSKGAAETSYVSQNRQTPLERLKAGNEHFVKNQLSHKQDLSNRRLETSKEQHPFAAILGCADSRVPPEIIFDQSLGDLFVVRDAGAVVDNAVLGSLEFAVAHLKSNFILVLGHKSCGAVQAALHGETEGHLEDLVKAITPALTKIDGLSGDEKIKAAVLANTHYQAEQLRSSLPILRELVKNKKLVITEAYYDLDSGKVEFY